jgi:hypothetical protein
MPNPKPDRRVIMRIELLPGVSEALAEVTERIGSTQVSVSSRIIDWVTSQPDVTQSVILGNWPEGGERPDVVRNFLKGIVAEGKKL